MTCSIYKIKNQKAKNLLRGLQNKDFNRKSLKTYNTLRQTTHGNDFEIVTDIILNSPLYEHLPFLDDFPIKPTSHSSILELCEQSLNNEVIFHCKRIQKHEDKLSQSIESAIEISKLIAKQSYNNSVDKIRLHINNFGYSLHILRKISVIFQNSDKLTEDNSKFILNELDNYGLSKNNLVTLSIVDSMESQYDYFQLRHNIIDACSNNNLTRFSTTLSSWVFRPILSSNNDIRNFLHEHGNYSLLDAYIFLMIHSQNSQSLQLHGLDKVISRHIKGRLFDLWEILCDILPESILADTEDSKFSDLVFYRNCIAWIENKKISNLRNTLDPLIEDPTQQTPATSSESQRLAKKYFNEVKSIDDICVSPTTYKICLESFATEHAGTITRTAALMHILRSTGSSIHTSHKNLLILLNNTAAVARISSIYELRTLQSANENDQISRYLISALIYDNPYSTNQDEHLLRRILQDVVMKNFQSNILNFGDYLYHNAPHVAEHFYSICTEDFLSQLFHLLQTTEEVFELRANLHDWYADRFDDEFARKKATTLRLDQKLAKVRGDIDDTRIFVDERRFISWLEDNYLEELSSALRSTTIDENFSVDFSEINDLNAQRHPLIRVASIMRSCFSQFCTNTQFGVASYIGRRIRHGTLKGHMLTQIRALINDPKFAPLMNHPSTGSLIRNWENSFISEINNLAKNTLHIESKDHPKGIINTNIFSSNKLDLALLSLKILFNSYKEIGNINLVSKTIHDYCWILLERELVKTRKNIEETKHSIGIISWDSLKRGCPEEIKADARAFCKQLNFLVNEKFKAVCDWFTKPANLSPSAQVSTLFDAVLSEVKSHYPNFKPNMHKCGYQDFEIIGLQYHHVYDFFHVVIYNAAEHGNPEGTIQCDIKYQGKTLKIRFSSEIAPSSSIESVVESINQRLLENNKNAMIIEGNSGIQKLFQMKNNIAEIQDIIFSHHERTVSFELLFKMEAIQDD